MSMPSTEPMWRRPFRGWSLAHFLIDGGLTGLSGIIGAKMFGLSAFEAVVVTVLSAIAITGLIMLWTQRQSGGFDFSEFQNRDRSFEMIRQSDNVTYVVRCIGQYMSWAPMDLTHQDHSKLFLDWREVVSAFLTAVANERIVRDFRTHCEPDNPLKAQTYLYGLQATFSRQDLRDALTAPPQPTQAQLTHAPPAQSS